MDKKILMLFVLFIGFFAVFYIQINFNEKKSDELNKTSNKKKDNIEYKINNIKNIELYVTDFKSNNYTRVDLTDEQITKLKKELNDFSLNNKKSSIVYGKYKLVIDNKIIFFDPNNDFGLYMNSNEEIYFPNTIKQIIVSNEKLCSCCINSNCNINLCSCTN